MFDKRNRNSSVIAVRFGLLEHFKELAPCWDACPACGTLNVPYGWVWDKVRPDEARYECNACGHTWSCWWHPVVSALNRAIDDAAYTRLRGQCERLAAAS